MRPGLRSLLAGGLLLELLALSVLASFADLRAHIYSFLLCFALAVCGFLLACYALRRFRCRLWHIAAIALLLRLPLLFSTPSLSDDVWRYLHDGRAQLAGVNPYRYAPADPATLEFRGAEYPRINHPQLVTIYPPAAQAAFAFNALAGSQLWTWRILLLLGELVLLASAAAFLRAHGHGLANVALYAWHPLAVVEVAGSAHLEPLGASLLVAALVLASARRRLGAILLGLSVAVKYVAAPIALLLRPPTLVLPLAALGAALCFLPYVLTGENVLGSVSVFARNWQANGSAFVVLDELVSGQNARLLAAAVLLLLLFTLLRSERPPVERALYWLFALCLLSPVVHPWYLLWPLALIPLQLRSGLVHNALFVWTLTIPLSYLALIGYTRDGVWQAPLWSQLLQYSPVYALLAHAFIGKIRLRFRPRIVSPLP